MLLLICRKRIHALPKFHRTCPNYSNHALVMKEGTGLKQYLGPKNTWSMQESIFKDIMTNSHFKFMDMSFKSFFFH